MAAPKTKRTLSTKEVKVALRSRDRADVERKAAIRQLIVALGLIVDDVNYKDMLGEPRPPMMKMQAAREAIRHAGSFLSQAIAAERIFNKTVSKNIRHEMPSKRVR